MTNREDMLEDPRVIDPKIRSEKIGELYEMVADLVKDWKTAALLAALEEADIPHGEATGLDDLAADEHMQAVGFFQTFEHPSEGRIRLTSPPMTFSETPAEIRRLPATLGEHSVEILQEAGYTEAQISELLEAGVSVDGRAE